ncbi:type I-C CRISPR-associated endonuclease Cas1c [Meiothermus taiwanensis]|jgi:CRISPR-associated protein Cas1|uniref:CRISPR-associated endonuclease Cas1 n=1 Tax=Meiothermus taiwanensis TaxID=172827 RepID=A0A399E0K0_9DEIN|nr:type I-C CRISPR-associated endonuclease Cas1c [Meiothermus taiwanensis]KIQ53959.1 CRISPR-associated protein Cas1 [Meiothermus taiwanensis]KZK14982.1 subtype I-C CRISPR-associated endonuclease Cas1 [Meiothermus taiwanensis]RIH77043.1 CRISPR-associated endonuclease Cas1 [Meiothermus taiwanensis]
MNSEVLNTLYIQTQGVYLRLEGDTLRIEHEDVTLRNVPLHHLGGLALFGNVLVSPYLLHRCAQEGLEVTWFSESGRFQGRLMGPVSGNVLLRQAQYRALDNPSSGLYLAQRFVEGKLKNARLVLQRAVRERGETEALALALREHEAALRQLPQARSVDEVRGLEGNAASAYFAAFGDLLLSGEFRFDGRNKRPPRDPVNALLSFVYALLTIQCTAALEGVGLDPQAGFLHALRPGRNALALDLMEEFRAWWADRLALSLLNRKQLAPEHFETRPGGAVLLNEEGRKVVIVAFQTRRLETVQHPLFKEPVPVGLLPHIQARLLARYLRGDLPQYLPFVGR